MTQILEYEDFEQDITFEVSKEVIVVTKMKYRKNDIIGQLVKEINNLKNQVQDLNEKRIPTTKEDLVKLWDNEYDDQWNKC